MDAAQYPATPSASRPRTARMPLVRRSCTVPEPQGSRPSAVPNRVSPSRHMPASRSRAAVLPSASSRSRKS